MSHNISSHSVDFRSFFEHFQQTFLRIALLMTHLTLIGSLWKVFLNDGADGEIQQGPRCVVHLKSCHLSGVNP